MRCVIAAVVAASVVFGWAPCARAEAPKPSPPAKNEPTSDDVPTYVWIAGAVGLVASGAAVGFGLDASAAVDELEAACPATPSDHALSGKVDRVCESNSRFEIEDLDGRRQRSMTFAIGFSALGVGAIAAAIYGIVTAGEQDKKSARLLPLVSPNRLGLSFEGRF